MRVTAIAAAALLLLVRIAAVLRYRIDSDEPQHLHVVWGWTRGLVQYRDVFDNHMPLFHVLTAPLLWLVGERRNTLILMRAATLPAFFALVWLTYVIAKRCYGVREARWAALITATVPTFFLTSIEFRPDTLWAVAWTAAIAVIISDRWSIGRRSLLAGVLAGCAFALSMKTVLLLLSLVVAASVVAILRGKPHRWAIATAVPFIACAALTVAIVVAYFAWRGAGSDFYYGVFGHNLIWRWKPKRLVVYPCLLTLIAIAARHLYGSAEDATLASRRVLVFIAAHVYGATIFCLWPLVEREHFLPYVPLAVVGTLPFVAAARLRTAMIAVQAALIVAVGALWRDNTARALDVVDATLRVTRPGESVIDIKGETMFRQRAFRLVLEPITKQRIREGHLRDSIAADAVAHRSYVSVGDDDAFPANGRRFLADNFISVGPIRVAGRRLLPGRRSFSIIIPGRYALLGPNARHAFIDGKQYRGPMSLSAGEHRFRIDMPVTLTLLWARAAEKGFHPTRTMNARE